MRDLAALKTAARAAIVIPAVFAFADKVIGNPQTSLVAVFGGFALLVFVEFGGPPLQRLAAYLGLALVGAAFLTLGTLCSRNAWLAAGAMAVVGFATLFSAILGGYFPAASTGAILLFVLPATLPAPNSAIPDRLEGWGLACAVAIAAAMLLWPTRRRADQRREAAEALRAVAAVAETNGADDEAARLARKAVDDLGRRFLGTQHRPSGPTGPTVALASLPEELDWLLTFLSPAAPATALELACAEDREALAATAAVLRESADRLEFRDTRPDFARLDDARDAVAAALMRRLPDLPASTEEDVLMDALDTPFRIRVASYSARQLAGYALLATGADTPELGRDDLARPAASPETSLATTEQLAIEHATSESVWFQNSLRGAAGLAIAVYIAQRSGLQHGFWVVLGTLSVLRSNALGTGWSILSALAGTSVGLVAGALIVIGIGTHETVLWAVLPVAILVATYAPRAISFAAGQAAFTVVLFVLFNIVQPVGWRVGVIRVEDVSIGFAISLGVGLLFWPRGAAARLRRDLAAAYARAADSVVATARELTDDADPDAARQAGRLADAAIHRLDDAFRQFLTERSASRFELEDVGALVGGAARLRRAALSLGALARMIETHVSLERCGSNLDRELHALQSWYLSLGYAIANVRPVPPPHIRDAEGRSRLVACVREGVASADPATVNGALVLLWASQHLDSLWRLEAQLSERVTLARAAAAGAAPAPA